MRDDIYRSSLKSITDKEITERQRVKDILFWLTYAMRTLTLDELEDAISIQPEGDWPHGRSSLTEEKLRELCADFAVHDGHMVVIPHSTAVDFLKVHFSNIHEKPDLVMAERCITYLSHPDLKATPPTDANVAARLEKFPLIAYAANHWHEHFLISRAEGGNLNDRAVNMLSNKHLVGYIAKAMGSLKHEDGVTGLHLAAFLDAADLINGLLDRSATSGANPQGSDLEARTGSGETAFHFATKEGSYEAVEALLRRGADVNARDNLGRSALHKAIEEHKEDEARSLILFVMKVGKGFGRPADIDATDHEGCTPLISAARLGMVDVCRALAYAGAALDARDLQGLSALRWAALNEHDPVVELLLRRSVTVTRDDSSLLHWAIIRGNEYALQFLIHKVADLDLTTALLCAVQHRQRKAVWLLIEAGAKLDTVGLDGNTALHLSVEKDESILWLLLESGANPNSKNHDGDTPLHLAARLRKSPMVWLPMGPGADAEMANQDGDNTAWRPAVEDESITWLLLNKGADMNCRNNNDDTPLHVAAKGGKAWMSWFFVSRGADNSLRNLDGNTALDIAIKADDADVTNILLHSSSSKNDATPYGALQMAAREGAVSVASMLLSTGPQDLSAGNLLHVAAEHGQEGMMGFLIDGGTDVNARDSDGRTALHIATTSSKELAMTILLTAGADPNVVDARGFAPLHHAAMKQSDSAVTLLLDHGADPCLPGPHAATPIHLALTTQDDESPITALLVQKATPQGLDLLNDQGFDEKGRELGSAAVHIAVSRRHPQSLKLLAKHGADADSEDKRCVTPLMMAIECPDDEEMSAMVSAVIDAGADVNRLSHVFGTPLHHAAGLGQFDAIDVMYQKARPDRTIVDSDGKTPEQLAVEEEYYIDWSRWD